MTFKTTEDLPYLVSPHSIDSTQTCLSDLTWGLSAGIEHFKIICKTVLGKQAVSESTSHPACDTYSI